jgi:predicted RecA/RadA family phage recombinase
MATNEKFEVGDHLAVACTLPTTPVSGDPVVFGQRPGVALTDERADGRTSVQFNGVFALAVVGAGPSAGTAVVQGDILYYDAGEINRDATNGIRYGYAYNPLAHLPQAAPLSPRAARRLLV